MKKGRLANRFNKSLRFQSGCTIYVCWVIALSLVSPSTGFAGYKKTFTPKAAINEEYTGNVFYTNEDTQSDFVTVVSAGFDLEISTRNNGFNFSYMPEASFYSENSENNTLRHTANLNGWWDYSKKTKISVFDSFKRTEEPLNPIEDVITAGDLPSSGMRPDTTRRKGLQPFYTNDVGFQVSHQFSKTDAITLGYTYSILENEDPEVEDNARHSPSIGYSHRFNPYMDIAFNGGYTRGIFQGESDDVDEWTGGVVLTRQFTKKWSGNLTYNHTMINYDSGIGDYQVYDPSVGFGYVLDEDMSLSLNVGYFIQDKKDGDSEKGLSISGDIGKNWAFKRGSIALTGSSGYDQSYFGAENLGFYSILSN